MDLIRTPLTALALLMPCDDHQVVQSEIYGPVSLESSRNGVFGTLTEFAEPVGLSNEFSILSRLIWRIQIIKNLENNWDGNNACSFEKSVISNTIQLLQGIQVHLLSEIAVDDISPSPYGTIFLELDNGGEELSIEIGNSAIHYFSECEEGNTISSKTFNLESFKDCYDEINSEISRISLIES